MNKPHLTSNLTLNWPSLIVLVRHGESEGNKYGRQHMAQVLKKPSYRFALTPLGVAQAKSTAVYLDERFGLDEFDAYFTSTYSRAQETFAHIFEGKKKNGQQITPIIDARVNEITRGYASVVPSKELLEKHPFEMSTFLMNGWFHNIPLGGQSCVQIEHVIHTFLAYLREGCAGKKVIIVGHGTWINLFCRIMTHRGIDESELLHEQQFYKNASVTVFEKDESGHMALKNDGLVPWEEKIPTED